MNDIITYYSGNAGHLVQRYEKLKPETVNAAWAHLVPESKSMVLDVGAGSGRDAAWFAGRGHRVVAVEPADNLRTRAMQLHPHDAIRWVNDRMPDLEKVRRLNRDFDVILVSAVWMHLPHRQRSRAFATLYALLKPDAIVIISYRQGPAAEGPAMFAVADDELPNQARLFDMDIVLTIQNDDMYNRTEVRWRAVVLKRLD
jgi:protein-L-isoaspartate O-methyltransferase